MAVSTKTRSQLVTRALEKLGATRAGQAASSEDFDLVDDLVDGFLEDLAARDIIYIPDPSEIPVAAYDHLATALAFMVGADFGPTPSADAVILAESRLRVLAATRPTHHVLKTEYF